MPVTCDFRGGAYFRSPLNYTPSCGSAIATENVNGELMSPTRRHRSPITRLPIEVLGLIFSHSLNHAFPLDFDCLAGLISPTPNADPEIFSQVCRYWRSIILSMPLLWSTMYIYGPKKVHEARLTRWLERSQNCLLTFQLTESWTADPLVLHNILSQLISQVHRWKDIHIYVSPVAQHTLLGITPGVASSLISADMHLRDWDPKRVDDMWQIFHASKSLRRAEWEDLDLKGPPVNAPWAQLTHIFFHHRLTPAALLDILYTCEQIIELRVQSLIPGPLPARPSDLVLPHLRLWVMDSYGVDPGHVIDKLTLPSLTHLRVPEHNCTRPSLLNLLKRSSCRLRTFVLDDAKITEDRILTYLVLPELKTVTNLILRVPLTDKIVCALVRHGEHEHEHARSGGLFHKLEKLHIKDLTMPKSRLSDGLIAAVVHSRQNFDMQRGLSPLRLIGMGYMAQRERHFPCDLLWLMGMGRLDDRLSILLTADCISNWVRDS